MALIDSPLYVRKSDFKESEHPRADDGKFGEGGGGSSENDLPEVEMLSEEEEKLHDASNWTPSKTAEAAKAWSKDSEVTITLYHGTNKETAEKITSNGFNTGLSAFGRGVYLSADKSFADAYQRGAREGKGITLETKINVEKMLPIKDSPTGYAKAAKQLGLSKQQFDKLTKEKLKDTNGSQLQAMGEAIREAAESKGYHGLNVDSSKPFYVVFDPKRVTTISGESKGGLPSPLKSLRFSPLYRRKSAQFDESKHPRADDGKFGIGSGSPKKPIKFIPHHNQRDDETTIYVDPKKIDESWKNVEDEYLPPSKGGKSEVAGRRAGVEEFLKKEKPVEASRMILHEGEVSFIDGRHRMAVMRDRGESRMAVTVPKDQADEFKRRFGVKSLGRSPLYVRKAAPGQFDENKVSRDAGKFSSQPGAGAAPKPAASPGAGPDAKTQGYVQQLKERFGDQALTKLQEMRAKVADDPAKVAAIDKIYAAMKPPSRQAANKEVAGAQAGVDAARMQIETHDEAMAKGKAKLEEGFDAQHQEILSARDAKIAQIKKESEERLAAIKAKHEAKRGGLPSPLKGKEPATTDRGFEDGVMTSPLSGPGFFGGTKTVELDANPGIRKIAKMAQGSDAGVRGLIDKNGSIVWDGDAALHKHVREHLNRPNADGFHIEKRGKNQYTVTFFDANLEFAQAEDYMDSRLFRDANPKLIDTNTLLITIKSLSKSLAAPVRKGLGASPLYSRLER